ncbi:hypothetical protein BpHYR1_040106 [Brachionus plicatilis]|uniref:Uncharacterized protein n=1 Tax=Brachionus plicatilis TaxID=10195 RepID=A0A3M7PPG4_BRAPC|nr:hypothetical protein BpHYR1_040106 [Brachionus plicatilis]
MGSKVITKEVVIYIVVNDMGLVPMSCDKVDSFDCHVVRSGTCNFHMLDGHKPFQQLNYSFQTVLNKLDTGHH